MGSRIALLLVVAVMGSGLAPTARAEEVCQGPRATAGAVIHGPVVQIPDGSNIWVALGPLPSTWSKIPLPRPATTRSALMAAAFGKNATCVMDFEGQGDCLVEGKPLTDELRRPEIVKASAAWR